MTFIKSLQATIRRSTAGSSQIQTINGNTLRYYIGLLALALPSVLIFGSILFGDCESVQGSISAYYHTTMRDLFVGILAAIAFSMLAYEGYSKVDARAADLAGLMALGVAYFPTSVSTAFTVCLPSQIVSDVSWLHYLSAATLFLILAFFCLVLFTMTSDPENMTDQKRQRNVLYNVCGYGILVCMAVIVWSLSWDEATVLKYKPVFMMEAFALLLFSVSWLVKGEFFMTDK